MVFHNEKYPVLGFFNCLSAKENKKWMLIAIIIIIVQFAIFKLFYPFPNFMHPDSDNYLEAAMKNDFINIWPIGYSKFLRLVSCLTKSHLVLINIQYLVLEIGILYLVFSIKFFLSPNNWIFIILLFSSILNPIIPIISNYVSSDALFTALSLVWFTQLIWILSRPSGKLLLAHGLILLLVFTVRYNALYYPLISISVVTLTSISRSRKIFITVYIMALLGIFIERTGNEYRQNTGAWQFSAFGGWQIASNSLYSYAHVPIEPTQNMPKKFQKLHDIVNRHMDSLNHLKIRPDQDVAIYYLWDFKSPLRLYMDNIVLKRKKSNDPFLSKWSLVSPLYSQYGFYLILKYPFAFLKYYVRPNLIKYYVPPLGFLDPHRTSNNIANKTIAQWFAWSNNNLPNKFKINSTPIMDVYPIFNAIVNVIYLLGIIGFYFLKGHQSISVLTRRILTISFTIWLSNMIFSVFAAPIELRYQIFPLSFTFCFAISFVAFLIQKSKETKTAALNVKYSSAKTLIDY